MNRRPQVSGLDIIQDFVPPPRFAQARFSTYLPDPKHASQQTALDEVQHFAKRTSPARQWQFWRKTNTGLPGIYLDGGYGVGKTHLLASLWHTHPGPATFASFVEYTNLVGALGFIESVELLSSYALICIDEFELDDPGDTVLMSTLLHKLVDHGSLVAATSNTLPDRLGEGRFAAQDFIREIQGLRDHFSVVRIDGPDYRHRENLTASPPMPEDELRQMAAQDSSNSLDTFEDLDKHLTSIHPSSFGALISGIGRVHISKLQPLNNQAQALRWVVLIDRLYDRNIPISFSGCQIDELFSEEMLRGGYRKKYLRALSRLAALSREE